MKPESPTPPPPTPPPVLLNAEQLEAELMAIGGEVIELRITKAHVFYLAIAAELACTRADCGELAREVLQDFSAWRRRELSLPPQMTALLAHHAPVQTSGPGGPTP